MDIGSIADFAGPAVGLLGLGGAAFGYLQGRKTRGLEAENLQLQNRKAQLELEVSEARKLEESASQARLVKAMLVEEDGKDYALIHNESALPATELVATVYGRDPKEHFSTSWAVLRAGETYKADFLGERPATGVELRFKDAQDRYWRLNEYGKLTPNAGDYSRVVPRE